MAICCTFSKDMIFILFECACCEKQNGSWNLTTLCKEEVKTPLSSVVFFMALAFLLVYSILVFLNYSSFHYAVFIVY